VKKIIAGLGMILCGSIFYLSAFIVGAVNVSDTSSWPTALGRFWGTIYDYDLMLPIRAGVIIMVLGTALLLWGAFEQKSK
jgi:hypothetical protein